MTPKAFQPPWHGGNPPGNSWRALFKWGASDQVKHPNPRLYALMKTTFGMTDSDFRTPRCQGLAPADPGPIPGLPEETLQAFRAFLGEEGVAVDGFTRLSVAYGKTMLDLLRLREGIAENLPSAVLYPRDVQDVVRILAVCASRNLPVVAYGGGSSVTRGVECTKGGVTLNLRRHMNKIVRFNEEDQTITVGPGLYGPALEEALQRAPELFGAKRPYTCGHFPQSFEHSTVGGWVATRGAGQNSTYFGKIEDLVLSLEMATPIGVIRTLDHPAAATGPDTDQILIGSEGAFGILTEVTLKVFRDTSPNRQRFSYLFPDWDRAREAAREILQGQFGFPSVFRLSDPEETDVALKLYGVGGPLIDTLLGWAGLEPGKRCLLLGTTEGEEGFARNARACVARICRSRGALPATGFVTKAWEHGRFKDPYLRDDLQDFGILTDTLECAVTWSTLQKVHEGVRAYCHTRPGTLVLSHMSHGYPQGANLYFIFITRMTSIPDYLSYQAGILDAIRSLGATLSHHHGIGKMTAPWLEGQIGPAQLGLFRAIKGHLDPQNLMNPGGTLALDLPDDQRRAPAPGSTARSTGHP